MPPRLNLLPDNINQKLFGCIHSPPTNSELKHLKDFQIEDTSVWADEAILPLPEDLDFVDTCAKNQWAKYEGLIQDFISPHSPESDHYSKVCGLLGRICQRILASH